MNDTYEISENCIGCNYMTDDGCNFTEVEKSLAHAGIDCVKTYEECVDDMY